MQKPLRVIEERAYTVYGKANPKSTTISIPKKYCLWEQAFSQDRENSVCCVFTNSENLYVCPYSGEEVTPSSKEGYNGKCTGYCKYPK